MSDILLFRTYTVPNTSKRTIDVLFGRRFYSPDAGFGSFEEAVLDDGTPVTQVTFDGIEREPFVHMGIDELPSELSEEGDKLAIGAIATAIRHRYQERLPI